MLWQKQQLVDVTLAADGRFVHVHRIVLCASSDYFQVAISKLKWTSSFSIAVWQREIGLNEFYRWNAGYTDGQGPRGQARDRHPQGRRVRRFAGSRPLPLQGETWTWLFSPNSTHLSFIAVLCLIEDLVLFPYRIISFVTILVLASLTELLLICHRDLLHLRFNDCGCCFFVAGRGADKRGPVELVHQHGQVAGHPRTDAPRRRRRPRVVPGQRRCRRFASGRRWQAAPVRVTRRRVGRRRF